MLKKEAADSKKLLALKDKEILALNEKVQALEDDLRWRLEGVGEARLKRLARHQAQRPTTPSE